MALGAFGLTTNGTASDLSVTVSATTICTAITSLTGMQSCRVRLKLSYGSGGTAVKVYVQSSDDGTSWQDMACVVFNTATEEALLNFTCAPKLTQVTPTDGAMADDTAVDGILGDRVRLKVVSTGTFSGSTVLSGRLVAR